MNKKLCLSLTRSLELEYVRSVTQSFIILVDLLSCEKIQEWLNKSEPGEGALRAVDL